MFTLVVQPKLLNIYLTFACNVCLQTNSGICFGANENVNIVKSSLEFCHRPFRAYNKCVYILMWRRFLLLFCCCRWTHNEYKLSSSPKAIAFLSKNDCRKNYADKNLNVWRRSDARKRMRRRRCGAAAAAAARNSEAIKLIIRINIKWMGRNHVIY